MVKIENFVDADEAAKFLSITRRRILDLARTGKLPAHPIGDGVRPGLRHKARHKYRTGFPEVQAQLNS
jgi:hypothetical protein